MPEDTMRVRVEMTVEVSREAWTANFGVEGDKAIREDVKNYVAYGTSDQIAASGCSPVAVIG